MNDDANIPVTEADLHAYADAQLTGARRSQVEAFLAARPKDAARVQAWMADNQALRALLDPVLHEPIPVRMPLVRARLAIPWRQFALAASIAFVSAGAAWMTRGVLDDHRQRLAATAIVAAGTSATPPFARRAAVAHVVYSPEVRRPVEVGADQEEQLVAWLSKRLNATVKPPHLGRAGYELIGGRLLPGEKGPVAQFMYHDANGQRLTLYVTHEAAPTGDTAFRFAQEGPVNVFYWVDGKFGYAISAGVDRNELHRIAREVYRQLAPG